jgi:hypothetical protein
VIASQIRRAPQGANQRGQVPRQRREFLVLGLVLTRTRVLAHTRSVERRQPEGHKHHTGATKVVPLPSALTRTGNLLHGSAVPSAKADCDGWAGQYMFSSQ